MLNKYVKCGVFFILILMLISCNGKKVESNLKVSSFEYVSDANKPYEYKLVIPQIEYKEGEESEDISYFNVTLKEEARYVLENLSSEKEDGKIREAYINFINHENSFGVLSISILTNVYTGGAHFINKLESYNINLKDKSILTFDKIFNENAVEYFNRRINDMIKNGDKILNTKGNEVIFFENAEADVRNAILTFEEDKVVFTFSEYDLSPYSSGMPVFKFDKKDIKKFLDI